MADVSNGGVVPEPVRKTLEWLASEEAWTITTSFVEDGRFSYNPPADNIYSTPWGLARAALKTLEPSGV